MEAARAEHPPSHSCPLTVVSGVDTAEDATCFEPALLGSRVLSSAAPRAAKRIVLVIAHCDILGHAIPL